VELLTGVEEISRQADRISKTLQHLRSLINRDQIQLKPCDLNGAVEQSLRLMAKQLAGHNIAVDTQLADPLPKVNCIPTALEEVVINLLSNAMQALGAMERGDKRIWIRTAYAEQVILEVGDNGPGVSPDLAAGVFEPFVSTKETGDNMGLGLAIVNSIVTTYHGKVELIQGPLPGAMFRISFPAAADAEKEG
jgi:C4-dicarboxylate-specific signal transduction histidine kinase